MRYAVAIVLLTLLNATSLVASSYDQDDSMSLTVTETTITEVEPGPAARIAEMDMVLRFYGIKTLGEVISIGEGLVALGTQIWDIVKDGEPNIDIKMATPISVLPYMSDGKNYVIAFHKMDQWLPPVAKTYEVAAKNAYGSTLAAFKYNIVYQYGGKSEGKGSYLAGLHILASSVETKWGVSFNASSELKSVTNLGTIEDPIAGVVIQLDYEFGTVFSKVSKSETFYVTGEGEFLQI